MARKVAQDDVARMYSKNTGAKESGAKKMWREFAQRGKNIWLKSNFTSYDVWVSGQCRSIQVLPLFSQLQVTFRAWPNYHIAVERWCKRCTLYSIARLLRSEMGRECLKDVARKSQNLWPNYWIIAYTRITSNRGCNARSWLRIHVDGWHA